MCNSNKCDGHGESDFGLRIRIAPYEKSLKFLHPEIDKEYRGAIDSGKLFPKSTYRCMWECSRCGYKYEACVFNRVKSKGCKKCAIKRQRTARPGESLAEKYPDVASEYTGDLDPYTINYGSHDYVGWMCSKCGNRWSARIEQRTRRGVGCPKCGRIKSAKGRSTAPFEKSMAFKYPGLVDEYLGEDDPKNIYYGSKKKCLWRCKKCSNKWRAVVSSRTVGGVGCPRCGKKKLASMQRFCKYEDSLFANNKKLLEEYRGSQDPKTVSYCSGITFDWECSKCKNKWRTSVNLRRRTGCPKCAIKKMSEAQRKCEFEESFAFLKPELLLQYIGETDPKTIYNNSSIKQPWRCNDCDHVWLATPCDRVRRGDGCPCCARSVCVPGKNDMSVTHPHLAAEYVGDPTVILAGTSKKLEWKCSKCFINFFAAGGSRVCQKSGCPRCAKFGHDQTKPSLFYLLARPGQFKFGIMNTGTTRLAQHARKGWEVLEKVEMTGRSARAMETDVKRRLNKLGIPMGKKAFRKFFDGCSEVFQSVDLEVDSLRDLCQKLDVDLDSYLAQ